MFALDGGGFVGEFGVADYIAEPCRIVAAPQMKEPCVFIDAIGQFEEKREVVRAQLEPILRPAKVETALGDKHARRIFAHMTATLRFGRLHANDARIAPGVAAERLTPPDERLTDFGRVRWPARHRDARGARELLERFPGPGPAPMNLASSSITKDC
ncbi:hypothetical protein AWB76_07440 [Caballeronia temeraria]|uniref:Uncharacterized protein n=1 Tax=Caballeronia temeraria TaxID=1777137 RepID=A0A158DTA7_9BURK|nr:hypothetical protein [Caballeronia temeraria]SAK97670.1 hypothetical protein AWB76_07440 [Caballeronia temeraria]